MPIASGGTNSPPPASRSRDRAEQPPSTPRTIRSKRARPQHAKDFDMAKEQNTGVVLGIAMSSFRKADGEEHFRVLPGDDVKLTFPTAGTPPKAVSDKYTVVDFYESKMLEYDANSSSCPSRSCKSYAACSTAQRASATSTPLRSSCGPAPTATRSATSCGRPSRRSCIGVETWRDKQGALLAAVQMETTILNILLFLIIAVAGFGILAIFYMIVVEKTRDIGILKSLGASGRGVMGIFLTYGLSLGLVGSGVGLIARPDFVHYINPHRRLHRLAHRPAGVQSRNLLPVQDSDDRLPGDGALDRRRGTGHRRVGKRAAGASCRPVASRGGTAL